MAINIPYSVNLSNFAVSVTNLIEINGFQYNSYHKRHFAYYALCYVSSGNANIVLEKERYKLTQGDVFYIAPNVEFKFSSIEEDAIIYLIGFISNYEKDLLFSLGFSIKSFDKTSLIYKSNELEDLFISLFSLKKSLSYTYSKYLLIQSNFFSLLALLSANNENEIKFGDRKESLDVIVDYIEKNYMKNINMNDLENVSNLHRSNIYRLFMKVFEQSPKNYILNKRLKASISFLINTNNSIKSISSAVGFNSPIVYSHSFKNFFKCSPSEFRLNKGAFLNE